MTVFSKRWFFFSRFLLMYRWKFFWSGISRILRIFFLLKIGYNIFWKGGIEIKNIFNFVSDCISRIKRWRAKRKRGESSDNQLQFSLKDLPCSKERDHSDPPSKPLKEGNFPNSYIWLWDSFESETPNMMCSSWSLKNNVEVLTPMSLSRNFVKVLFEKIPS